MGCIRHGSEAIYMLEDEVVLLFSILSCKELA